MSNSYQTHHFNFMNHLIQLSCISHNSHTTSFIKAIQFIILKVILIQACCPLLKSRKTSRPTPFSPSISLRQKGLAQARRTLAQASSLRLGESSTSNIRTLHAFSLRRDPPRLSETFARLKSTVGRLDDHSGKKLRRAPVNFA